MIMSGNSQPASSGKLIIFAAIIVVLVSVVSAIIITPPREAFQKRQDQQRINDLQKIYYSVARFWRENKKLPQSLEVLTETGGSLDPKRDLRDPETGTPYVYEATGDKTYKICANFYFAGEASDWRHNPGYVCFDKTITD